VNSVTSSDGSGTDTHEVGQLRALLASHQDLLEQTEGNEFIELEFARSLHRKLASVLDRWDTFTDTEQREVIETAQYLVETDDEEHDLHSPIGFVDDGERIDALLLRIAPDLLS
jgi:hypothetical protein